MILNKCNLNDAEFKYNSDNITEQQKIIAGLTELFKSTLILLLATLIGYVFFYSGFTEANLITVYILAVLVISIFTKHRIYSLLSSAVSVLIFNFCFTEPRFAFLAYAKGYPITFLIMFIAAFITSSLAIKLKNNAYQSKLYAFRTKILFDTNQILQKAADKTETLTAIANQIVKSLKKILLYIT